MSICVTDHASLLIKNHFIIIDHPGQTIGSSNLPIPQLLSNNSAGSSTISSGNHSTNSNNNPGGGGPQHPSSGGSMMATGTDQLFPSIGQPGLNRPIVSTTPTRFECDKCNLNFSRLDMLKEHQLMHILNPEPSFFNELNPFAFLQNFQPTTAAATTTPNNPTMATTTINAPKATIQGLEDLSKRPQTILGRKFSTDSAASDAMTQPPPPMSTTPSLAGPPINHPTVPPSPALSTSSAGPPTIPGVPEEIAKKFQKEQFDFLLNYFLQNEPNDDLKNHSANNLNFEFLFNYYQTNEIKKNNLLKNYDFLHQYYQQHRDECDGDLPEPGDKSQQPLTLDFLLQFYQLTESKKLFQQHASQAFSSNISTTSSSSHTGALDERTDHSSSTVGQQPANVVTTTEKQTNKRLRTTILPEQLNFLYECYQNESNPSRKMLEEISKKVNLKKRVVQVK